MTVAIRQLATTSADFEAEFGKKSSAIDEAWLAQQQDFTETEGNF